MNNIVHPPMPPIRWEVEDSFWDMILRPGRKEKELNAAEQRRYELEMAEFRGYMNGLKDAGKR